MEWWNGTVESLSQQIIESLRMHTNLPLEPRASENKSVVSLQAIHRNQDGVGREQQNQPNISFRLLPCFYSCESCEIFNGGKSEKKVQVRELST